jgi:glycosyltransferase involved in cell wall biosynthesis
MESERPVVTISMPVHNNEGSVARAIRSILLQTCSNWELLIIDDGSRDRTLSLARSFDDRRIKVLSDGRRMGVVARLNQSIDLTHSEYFARLDGDDVAYPTRIDRQLKYLKDHPDVDLVGTQALVFGSDGRVLGARRVPERHEVICRRPIAGFPLVHPSFFGRTDFFRAFRYRPSATRGQDQDLLLRSFSEARFANVPEILIGYNEGRLLLRKLLRGRLHFSQSILMELGWRRHHWTPVAVGVAGQALKACVDIVAVTTGLNHRLLRHRARPVDRHESEEWMELWRQVSEDLRERNVPNVTKCNHAGRSRGTEIAFNVDERNCV